jgi:hypothetical protein
MAFAKTRNLAAIAFIFSLALSPAFAKTTPPKSLIQEPVFGLQYEPVKTKLDIMPNGVQSKCMEMAGTTTWTVSQSYIFATARDAYHTYYVVGDYARRRTPKNPVSKFRLTTLGGVIAVEGQKCEFLGATREVFEARNFKEIPKAVLQQLANDLAVRLVRASGSPNQLRTHLRRKQINGEALPKELQEAFKAFFPR